MSGQMQKAQRVLLMVLPIAFIPFILNFPSGLMIYWLTTNLWTTGQGLVTRRLMPKPATPEKRSSRTPAKAESKAEPPPVEDGNGKPAGQRGQPRRVRQEEGRLPTVSEELSVEATGETVGEAKWAALRDLERLAPGLDKSAVASKSSQRGSAVSWAWATSRPACSRPSTQPRLQPPHHPSARAIRGQRGGGAVRELVERVADEIGASCTVRIEEREDEILAVCEGPELGLLIGRHGQTIDAIQYLANAIVLRRQEEGTRMHVVVDAAGYRDRREVTLHAFAAGPPSRRRRPATGSSSSR